MNRYKRLASILLAAALAASLGACASGTEEPGGGEAAPDVPSGESDGTSDSGEPSPDSSGDLVTLRVYAPVGGETPLTAGLQDDPVAKKIEEDTGVILDIELADPNKTQAMVASGDLYDFNVIDNVEYIEPLIRVEAVADLDGYLDLAPALTGSFSGLIDYSRDYLSAGTGGLYVLPSRAKTDPTPVYPSQDGNFIRWDYYEEIGAPEINGVDDLVDILAQIVENHPLTEDGKQIYGTATFIDWNLSGFRGAQTKKYNGSATLSPFFSYSLTDNSFHGLYDDRNDIWTSSEYYNKMNQRGILDPESFTQKYENVVQKIAEGRVMTMQAEWYFQSINMDLNASTGGAAKYVDIPFADTAEFPAWYDRSAPFGYTARMFVLSSKCEHPDKAVALLNWLYSVEGSRTIFNGVKGMTWDDADGQAAMFPDALESIHSDSAYTATMGINKLKSIVGQDYDAIDQSTGTYVDLMQERDVIKQSMSAADQAYAAHYGAEIPLDVIGNRQNKVGSNLAYEALMPTEIPTDISRAVARIENYLMQELPILIQTGSDEEFQARKEEIKEELRGQGYDEVDEFYRAAFEAAVAKYEDYR